MILFTSVEFNYQPTLIFFWQLQPDTVLIEVPATGIVQLPAANGAFDDVLPGCVYDVFGTPMETSNINNFVIFMYSLGLL